MSAVLVDVAGFRDYAGIGLQVGDDLLQAALDEAEAQLVADVGCPAVDAILAVPAAVPIAEGDVRRRAANLFARRNSPEGIAGAGDDMIITVPAGDPGSPAAVRRIRRLLGIAAGGMVVVA